MNTHSLNTILTLFISNRSNNDKEFKDFNEYTLIYQNKKPAK